jgi:hypothetical protein
MSEMMLQLAMMWLELVLLELVLPGVMSAAAERRPIFPFLCSALR